MDLNTVWMENLAPPMISNSFFSVKKKTPAQCKYKYQFSKFHRLSIPFNQSIVVLAQLWNRTYCVCLFVCVMHNIAYIKWIIFISCSRQSSANSKYISRSMTIVRSIFENIHIDWSSQKLFALSCDIARFDRMYALFEIVSFFISNKAQIIHTDAWLMAERTQRMVIGEVDHGEGDALFTYSRADALNRASKAEKKQIEIGMGSFCAVQLLFSGKSKHLIRKINLIRLDWHFAIDRSFGLSTFFTFERFPLSFFPNIILCMIQ